MTLEAFKHDCSAMDAIHWYTCDNLIYSHVNKVLREQDITVLHQMEFLIRQLHEQITQLYSDQKPSLLEQNITLLKVYRGVFSHNADFDSIKSKQLGGFLSTNSFLSTTTDENTAIRFSKSTGNEADGSQVPFDIELDVTKCKVPFPDIQEKSLAVFEKEILFTMGAVFTIQSISRDENALWRVNLKLTDEEDEKLRQLKSNLELDVFHLTPIFQLARLMEKTGLYVEAIRLYNQLLPSGEFPIKESYQDVAAVHHNLAVCYEKEGKETRQFASFEKPSILLKHREETIIEIFHLFTMP